MEKKTEIEMKENETIAYEKPEIQVIRLADTDVITDSGDWLFDDDEGEMV